MCFQDDAIILLDSKSLKWIDLGSNISSTESDVDLCIDKTLTATDSLLTIWKSDLPVKMKWEYFQVVAVSILLYGYTTQTLMKRLEKKLNGNYTRINKS